MTQPLKPLVTWVTKTEIMENIPWTCWEEFNIENLIAVFVGTLVFIAKQ